MSKQRNLSRLTKNERDFLNNPDNFASSVKHESLLQMASLGDIAHKNGNFRSEASYHREVQENLYGMGYNRDKYSRHAYAWNSLYVHSAGIVDHLQNNGFGFNQAFYYDPRSSHYYLQNNARSFLDGGQYFYPVRGTTSLVNMNGYPTTIYIPQGWEYQEPFASW